jgi:hypothetical protein
MNGDRLLLPGVVVAVEQMAELKGIRSNYLVGEQLVEGLRI